jgi:hypothetical protein
MSTATRLKHERVESGRIACSRHNNLSAVCNNPGPDLAANRRKAAQHPPDKILTPAGCDRE